MRWLIAFPSCKWLRQRCWHTIDVFPNCVSMSPPQWRWQLLNISLWTWRAEQDILCHMRACPETRYEPRKWWPLVMTSSRSTHYGTGLSVELTEEHRTATTKVTSWLLVGRKLFWCSSIKFFSYHFSFYWGEGIIKGKETGIPHSPLHHTTDGYPCEQVSQPGRRTCVPRRDKPRSCDLHRNE